MTWTWRNILLMAGGILMLYLIGLLSIYILINPIIFKTERTNQYKTPVGARIQEIEVPLPGNQILFAHYQLPRAKPKGVILILHGANGNLDRYQYHSQIFVAKGFAVMMPDFRGFGKSRGALSENSLAEDALACLDWINKRFREDSVYLFALDFLAPVACYVNTLMPARALILSNPVYNLRHWIRDRYPAFFLPYELKYDFNLHEFLPNCLSPVFIIRPQHHSFCSKEDALKIKQILKDPNTFFQLDDLPNENMYELESYHHIIDQIIGYEGL